MKFLKLKSVLSSLIQLDPVCKEIFRIQATIPDIWFNKRFMICMKETKFGMKKKIPANCSSETHGARGVRPINPNMNVMKEISGSQDVFYM